MKRGVGGKGEIQGGGTACRAEGHAEKGLRSHPLSSLYLLHATMRGIVVVAPIALGVDKGAGRLDPLPLASPIERDAGLD